MFLEKNFGIVPGRTVGWRRLLGHLGFFFTRVWGGFFSAVVGFVETYVSIKGYGYTFLQSKAVTRIPHFLANIASVAIFANAALIDYRVAIALFVGMLLGGYIGTGFAIYVGDARIKLIVGVVILAAAIDLLFF